MNQTDGHRCRHIRVHLTSLLRGDKTDNV